MNSRNSSVMLNDSNSSKEKKHRNSSSSKHNAYNATLSVYRLLFAFCVVINHTLVLELPQRAAVLFGGYLSVEFFFMITGYLTCQHIQKLKADIDDTDLSSNNLGSETISYIVDKIKRLFPDYLIALILDFVLVHYIARSSFAVVTSDIAYRWSELLFLDASMIITKLINRPTWYLSSMFISLLVLYPLLRKNLNVTCHIICPILVILIYGYFSQIHHSVALHVWTGLASTDLLRGIAGISMGCIAYTVVDHIKEYPWLRSRTRCRVYRTIRIMLFIAIVYVMAIIRRGESLDAVFTPKLFTGLLLIWLLVVMIFHSHEVFAYQTKHLSFYRFCARFSVLLYLYHRFVVYFVNWKYGGKTIYEMVGIYIVGSLLITIIAYLLDPVKLKVSRGINRGIARLLFSDGSKGQNH